MINSSRYTAGLDAHCFDLILQMIVCFLCALAGKTKERLRIYTCSSEHSWYPSAMPYVPRYNEKAKMSLAELFLPSDCNIITILYQYD